MKTFVILLLISSHALANISWPSNMYTVESLFTEQFSTIKTYIQNLKINYAYKETNNGITFFKQINGAREEVLKLIIKRDIQSSYIKEEVLFYTYTGFTERFRLERWGANLYPIDNRKLTSFSFSIPKNVDEFRYEFILQKLYQHVEYEENLIRSNYRLYDYGLEINHLEEIQESRLFSKLWYQCDVCSGEPIIALMDTREEFLGNMSFYYESPLEFVTPKQFFAKANRSYLSGIRREFRNIPTIGIFEFSWPSN